MIGWIEERREERRAREGLEGRERVSPGGGRIEGVRIAFWNVAGLGNKDKDFWKRINEWDVVVMLETWLEEKGWERQVNERI